MSSSIDGYKKRSLGRPKGSKDTAPRRKNTVPRWCGMQSFQAVEATLPTPGGSSSPICMCESSIVEFDSNIKSLYMGKLSDNVSSRAEGSEDQNLLLLESCDHIDSAIQSSFLSSHLSMIHEIDHGVQKLTAPNEKSENLIDDPFHYDWPYW
jgi:hypothetical protein